MRRPLELGRARALTVALRVLLVGSWMVRDRGALLERYMYLYAQPHPEVKEDEEAKR